MEQTTSLPDGLANWFVNGERGISSNVMAAHLSGIPYTDNSRRGQHPLDPSDFNRCVKLLDEVPEFRDRLSEMRTVSKVWARLIDHWDEFEALLKEEWPTGRSPKLYKRMREIGC